MKQEYVMMWITFGGLLVLLALLSSQAGPEMRKWYDSVRRQGFTHSFTIILMLIGIAIACAVWPYVLVMAFKRAK